MRIKKLNRRFLVGVKKQIKMLDYNKTQELISKTTEIELLIKKNPQLSLNITTDFVMSHAK